MCVVVSKVFWFLLSVSLFLNRSDNTAALMITRCIYSEMIFLFGNLCISIEILNALINENLDWSFVLHAFKLSIAIFVSLTPFTIANFLYSFKWCSAFHFHFTSHSLFLSFCLFVLFFSLCKIKSRWNCSNYLNGAFEAKSLQKFFFFFSLT